MFNFYSIIRTFLVIFVGYFFSSALYINILYFVGIKHNSWLYTVVLIIGLTLSYIFRKEILLKFKSKPNKGKNNNENN